MTLSSPREPRAGSHSLRQRKPHPDAICSLVCRRIPTRISDSFAAFARETARRTRASRRAFIIAVDRRMIACVYLDPHANRTKKRGGRRCNDERTFGMAVYQESIKRIHGRIRRYRYVRRDGSLSLIKSSVNLHPGIQVRAKRAIAYLARQIRARGSDK